MSSKLPLNDWSIGGQQNVGQSVCGQTLAAELCAKGWSTPLVGLAQLWSKSADETTNWSVAAHKVYVCVITDHTDVDDMCLIRVYDTRFETIQWQLDLRGHSFAYETSDKRFHVFADWSPPMPSAGNQTMIVSTGWTGFRFIDPSESLAFRRLIFAQTMQRLQQSIRWSPTMMATNQMVIDGRVVPVIEFKFTISGDHMAAVVKPRTVSQETMDDNCNNDRQMPFTCTTSPVTLSYLKTNLIVANKYTQTTNDSLPLSSPVPLVPTRDVLDKALTALSKAINYIQSHHIQESSEIEVDPKTQPKSCFGLETIDECLEDIDDKSTTDTSKEFINISSKYLDKLLMASEEPLSSPQLVLQLTQCLQSIPQSIDDLKDNKRHGICLTNERGFQTMGSIGLLPKEPSFESPVLDQNSLSMDDNTDGHCFKTCTNYMPLDPNKSLFNKVIQELNDSFEDLEECDDNDEEVMSKQTPIDISLRQSFGKSDGNISKLSAKPESMDQIIDEIMDAALGDAAFDDLTSLSSTSSASTSLTTVSELSTQEESNDTVIDKQIPDSIKQELDRWRQSFPDIDWSKGQSSVVPTGERPKSVPNNQFVAIPDMTDNVYPISYHLNKLSKLVTNSLSPTIGCRHMRWLSMKTSYKKQLSALIDTKNCLPLSMVFLKLFLWSPYGSTEWHIHRQPVLCLVNDRQRLGYYLRVFDVKAKRMIWEREVTKDFDHQTPDPRFQELMAEDCRAGVVCESVGDGVELYFAINNVFKDIKGRVSDGQTPDTWDLDSSVGQKSTERVGKGFKKWFTRRSGKDAKHRSIDSKVKDMGYDLDETKVMIDCELIDPDVRKLVQAMIGQHLNVETSHQDLLKIGLIGNYMI